MDNTQQILAGDRDWIGIVQAAGILGCTIRHARRELAGVDAALVRFEQRPRGRPACLYHSSAHPALAAWAERRARQQTPVRRPAAAPASAEPAAPAAAADQAAPAIPSATAASPSAPRGASPDDLALAELRSEAVRLYIEMRGRLPEKAAAAQVVAAYAAVPRRRATVLDERLPGRHIRRHRAELILQHFSARTLQAWHSSWRAGGLMALVPDRKGRVGRHLAEIPDALLNIVHAWSVKNPRADIRKGIRAARAEWPGDWPDVSYCTWLRRLRARDPERFTETLGRQGISAFRARHSPDIERDYSAMAYNEEWQLDDATMDFYGLAWNHERLIRPNAYAVIRVATRQWIAVVATETPIVKDQVKSLLGLAMADPSGGIPARIRFERGAVACDAATQQLLENLGVAVHRTSMDGGHKHGDAFADKGIGHFQGKGVIERAIRSLHNQPGLWEHPLQVGTMERTSAAQNIATIQSMLLAEARAGRVIPRMSPADWHAAVSAAMELYNNAPHGALPEIVDPVASTETELRYRRMSPNEYAAKIAGEVRVLDQKLLPLFFQRGTMVEVGKNGFALGNFSYGRFDQDVQSLAGRRVTAFQLPEHPRVAYVAELGRCVDAWRMPRAGAEGELVETKRAIEVGKRNQYEALMADVLASGSQAVLDQTRILQSAVPMRVATVSHPELAEQAARQQSAVSQFIARQKIRDGRFAMPRSAGSAGALSDGPTVRSDRKSLLARGREIADQLVALGAETTRQTIPEESIP